MLSTPSLPHPSLMGVVQVNGQFVRLCKQGALQFVFLKPVLAVLTVVLFTQGGYVEGNWSPGSGYGPPPKAQNRPPVASCMLVAKDLA